MFRKCLLAEIAVCLTMAVAVFGAPPATAPQAGSVSRLKELVSVEGVRDNQLIGYGLVVGLAGTGDKRQTGFPIQSLTNLLERMGVSVSPTAIQVRNTAAVMVTATLPPFAQPGTRIDVNVAAVGDSTNLQGGLLLLTPLKSAAGQVFAVAQGPVSTGGFLAGRAGTNSQTVNHPTAGRVPQGAIVELTPPSTLNANMVRLQLRRADSTNAAKISDVINQRFAGNRPPVAHAQSPALVLVDVPPAYKERTVEFLAAIENLRIDPDRPAKIVINERTGTISLGKEIRLAPVSVLHGGLAVEIETTYDVSQPEPLSKGDTTVTPKVGVGVKEEKAKALTLKEGATVDDLVRGLQAIGATARDIISILQNLQSAGALEAELEII